MMLMITIISTSHDDDDNDIDEDGVVDNDDDDENIDDFLPAIGWSIVANTLNIKIAVPNISANKTSPPLNSSVFHSLEAKFWFLPL